MVQEIARQVAPNVFSIEKRLPLQNLRFNTTPHGALNLYRARYSIENTFRANWREQIDRIERE